FVWLVAALLGLPAALAAQTTGVVTGVVTDPEGRQLNAATVQIVGTPLRALTDVVGRYRLVGVPAGQHTLAVRSLGYQDREVTVTVGAGQTIAHDLTLAASPIALEGLVVTGQVGQAEAFSRQRTAPSIQNVVSSEHV